MIRLGLDGVMTFADSGPWFVDTSAMDGTGAGVSVGQEGSDERMSKIPVFAKATASRNMLQRTTGY